MSRRKSDPRVRALLAAFDRIVASPECSAFVVDSFMAGVVGTPVERFEDPTYDGTKPLPPWPVESVRAVLLAFALNCPACELSKMIKGAQREVEWIDAFERERAADRRTSEALAYRGAA